MADRPLLPWEKSDQKFDRPNPLDLGTAVRTIKAAPPKPVAKKKSGPMVFKVGQGVSTTTPAQRAALSGGYGPLRPEAADRVVVKANPQITPEARTFINTPSRDIAGGMVRLPDSTPEKTTTASFFQWLPRRIAQLGISATPQGARGGELRPVTPFQRAVFGTDPIKTLQSQTAGANETSAALVKKYGLPSILTPVIGGLATAGGVLADIYPGRPGGNIIAKTIVKEIEESVGKKVGTELAAKITREAEVILKLPKGEARASAIALLRKKYAPETLAANGFLAPRGSDKTLVAIHNLTDSNVRYSDKLGGIAHPSVAIVDTNKDVLTDFGEISLIAPKELIDPQTASRAKTYGADVYSPRFPETTIVKSKDSDQLAKKFFGDIPNITKQKAETTIYSVSDITELERDPNVIVAYFKERGLPIPKDYISSDGGFNYSPFRTYLYENSLYNDYESWVQELAMPALGIREELYAGRTAMGRVRTKPLTMDNVDKLMNRPSRGAEGFFYGLGSVRSKVTPQFKSLAGIKKAKGSILSKVEFTKIKDAMDLKFDSIIEELRPLNKVYKDSNQFIDYDNVGKLLGRFIAGQDGGQFRQWFPDIPLELESKIVGLRSSLKKMPTEYFETKFRRPVGLNEFSVAVIPDNTSEKTREILKNKGLNIIEYRAGDTADRANKIRKAGSQQAFGAVGGFQVETDEQGNKRLKYNPLAGALGVAGISAAKNKKVRGFIQSVKSSPIVSKITKAGFAKGGATYNVITDEQALEAAGKRIAASVSDSIAYVMGAKNPTKEHTTTAIKLIDTLEQNGNHSAASEVIEKYAADLTKQGQSVQAASLFGRLSPEGVLIYAQRQLNKYNQKKLFPQWTKSVILNEKDATVLRDLAAEVKRSDSLLSKNEAIQELQFALNAMVPSTIGRKISTAQTIAQLLNPKTFVRNILGNELFYRLERLNKIFVATPIDVLNSKLTGADRTITFRGVKGQESYWSAWLRGTKLGWKGITPEGLGTQFDLGRTATFTGKWNPFTYLEKTMGAALRGSDYAAFVRARNGVIGELAQLHVINSGLKGEARQKALQGFVRDLDENVLNIANEYGKYVTYQDDNLISTGFSAIKRGLNIKQDFGLGDLILKYPKTPGAILARALEYSPVGFLKSAYQVAYPFMHGAKPQTRDVIMSLSRAITGTIGATGLAYYLAQKGILTGKQETDPDIAALNRTVGGGGYKVNISALSRWVKSGFKDSEANTKEGDTMYSYDWAQPIAIAWSLGANAQKNVEEQKNPLDPRGIPETIMSSVEGAMQTILEQPLLRGLKNLSFRDMASFNNTFASIGEGIPASFVPTLFRQVQTLHNNIASETYDPRFFQKMMNEAKAKIPGLADKLNQRITTLGEPQEVYQGGSNNAFNVFFNPGFISKYTPVEVAQEVIALFERTGEKKHAPVLVKRKQSVNGQDIILSDDQYYEMQRFVGQETVKRYTTIIKSPKYQNMSDEDRVKELYNTLDDIRLEARIKILGHNPDRKKTAPTTTPVQQTQPTNPGRAKLPWE